MTQKPDNSPLKFVVRWERFWSVLWLVIAATSTFRMGVEFRTVFAASLLAGFFTSTIAWFASQVCLMGRVTDVEWKDVPTTFFIPRILFHFFAVFVVVLAGFSCFDTDIFACAYWCLAALLAEIALIGVNRIEQGNIAKKIR